MRMMSFCKCTSPPPPDMPKANMAVYSEATELFQFRCIPNITVNTSMTIENNGQRFEITSVENIKGRGMYLEVLAKTKTQGG